MPLAAFVMMEPDQPTHFYSTVDSTNDEARRRLIAGERPPFRVFAAGQDAGRGRNGRPWQSPVGNFYASFALSSDAAPASISQVSFVAALAAWDAIASLCPMVNESSLRLKWPNDIMLEGKKVAGLLLESWHGPGAELQLVVGIGINLCHAPPGLERTATSLEMEPSEALIVSALKALTVHLNRQFAVWDKGRGFAEIRAAWMARAFAIDAAITVNLNNGPIQGTFRGLDTNGSLLLDTGPGKLITVTAGDVSLHEGTADALP